jgi:hypothetical protein
VKKRAATVATDTSACCDNGRHDRLTDAKNMPSAPHPAAIKGSARLRVAAKR